MFSNNIDIYTNGKFFLVQNKPHIFWMSIQVLIQDADQVPLSILVLFHVLVTTVYQVWI